ncbi:YkvI family membrane protein [Macrococcus equipercicus]|uniref:Branched-chain amino acid transport system II carrier protein n=1 Tax=Macrococcus equipercicus TaxID=69967 RepID=A0A9Q9BRF9_9STAP|nr:hypothetical protein [Macrococcus equipercicus]KAA1042354.1 hypothetical protein ERX35_000285 [Macrococcus equipercicus]UTH14239.1 hypothetical protein KFV11_02435 [Macrococcus equipercicus]
MSKNKEAIKIGSAYVGVVVGAGFSTGQEVLKFFTNYGTYSYAAILIAGLMLAFFGREITKIGRGLEADSHESAINYLFGEKFGKVIDYVLVFFLYAISIIMLAGAGSAFNESFGVPIWLGSLIMLLAVIATLMMDFNKIVGALGLVTPFLIAVVTTIAVYFFFNGDLAFNEVNRHIDVSKQPSKSWWWDGILYGGLAFSTAFSMLTAIGGDSSRKVIAGRGGTIGGIVLLILLMMVNSGLLTELDQVKDSPIPSLVLGRMIHPALSLALSIIMLTVIYNTIVGLMYSFVARFTEPYSKKYVLLLVGAMVIGYFLSFIGFVDLVGKLYPAMGYIGLLLCVGILVKYFVRKSRGKKHIA